MLEVSWGEAENIAECRLAGRLDGAGAAVLDRALAAFADRELILDFGGVDFLSSAGVRSLLRFAQTQHSRGRTLVLCQLAPTVAQVLDLSGLLAELLVAETLAAARARVRQEVSPHRGPRELVFHERRYEVSPVPDASSRLLVWGNHELLSSPANTREALALVTLRELGLGWGIAGLGGDREQALAACGLFVASDGVIAVQPADGVSEPDDLVSERPDEVAVFVANAGSLAGTPGMVVEADGESTLGELIDDLFELAATTMGARPGIIGFALAADLVGEVGWIPRTAEELTRPKLSPVSLAEREHAFIVGVSWERPSAGQTLDEDADSLLARLGEPSTRSDQCFLGHAVRLAAKLEGGSRDCASRLRPVVASLGHRGVVRLDRAARVAAARGAVFLPKAVMAGEDTLCGVEVASGAPLEDDWLVIARRIYADASRVVLDELSGGFSATTFQAQSFDHEGRRMIPTVLKISTLDFTEREERAYHEHVKKFILNNTTVIMGRANQGRSAGLRYNFVGINGPESQLTWLQHHYRRRPFAELEPVLETVFGKILWAWYGQSRREEVALYAQHTPARIFPRIPEDGLKHLGIDPEAPTVACPQLGRDLPNPYRFLREELPRRLARTRVWPVAITHGDLNFNNILLDEKENLYVIDFSETRPRNAVADFARIEPLLAIEFNRLESEEDADHLLEMFAGLVAVDRLTDEPTLCYRGDDPMVEKAYRTICLLRRVAARVVAPETDIVPYLLPILEWTMPMVSYRQINPRGRRLSMLCSALICERLLELDP